MVLYVNCGIPTNDQSDLLRILPNQRKTSHFHIYTNLDEDSLDYYEHFFEGFYQYFNVEYFTIGQDKPLKVYLFKNTGSYESYARRIFKHNTFYGFYAGPKYNAIFVNRDSGLGTVTHELVHHFVTTSFVKLSPKWIDEGIATFFEKFIGYLDQEGRLTISFGYFSNWRFPITKMYIDRISLNDLIYARNPDQCAVRSFMLFLHKKGFFKSLIKQMRVQTDDPDGLITLQRVYGKSKPQIEQEWKSWIKSQPLDGNVFLVKRAFVKTDSQWKAWWEANKDRIYWNEKEQIFRIRE
ncbi:MAG: hypothetical protein GTO45_10480 [Candidatus Aminicenantes bacterium]|nr:hypothetical protein [Candidatus Aminicenantes bacterium]NIN18511.1 hypothetical protein [Candidatus Aminicenantes bacterium]NIN42407.1 hypothetical protein [Candidatus Aminicenantes bacterium]NIN85174.1 hypothetical protein [Candidatus Aminicenantes bacterium]NIO81379.1 hypothetical protein [Candidatus Aminicenantes bacterium]